MITDEDGTQCWFDDRNCLHRDCDLPAVIYIDGDMEWYCHGKLHRENGLPAVINISKKKKTMVHCPRGIMWYCHGKLHRDSDLPAIVSNNNTNLSWYIQGKLHRDTDKPAVIRNSGIYYWYKKGQLHRDMDGPAVIYLDNNRNTSLWYNEGVQLLTDQCITKVRRKSLNILELVGLNKKWLPTDLVRYIIMEIIV